MPEKSITPSLADYFIEQRRHSNTFLDKINQIVDFKEIEKLLKKNYKKTESADGRPAYPPLPMFKLLLLQRWYNLSDPGLEEALNDRISFIRFSGFSLAGSLPDYSTICRFRNALLELNLYEKLFEEITRQLESHSLLIKEGAIVDATIIESSRRPRKIMEIMSEDRKEEKTETTPPITYSDDPDAAWIKKGKKPYYGYKNHLTVDARNGYILGGRVTPADTTELERLVNESRLPEGSFVLADKGYAREKNRAVLADKNLKDGIMEKAARNRPLTIAQYIINRLISSVRYKVERSIGTLKRGYRFSRMCYIGLKKGNMEFLLNAMAFNLKKATAMIE